MVVEAAPPPAPSGSRRARVISWAIAAVVLVAVIAGLLALAGVGSSDSTPTRDAIRQRLDRIEADPFVVALLALPHQTAATMESLDCQPAGSSHISWNFRAVVPDVSDAGRLDAVVAGAAQFGWAPSPSAYPSAGPGPQGGVSAQRSAVTKTFDGGLPVVLYVVRYARGAATALELDANLSAGQGC